ncbi:hypothetical protein [Cellulomonas sp. NPDC058312]|jgi:hypothetical protein|uniref:hypothetical protein n=1 Tax=Cellulomonas sp. NPDC058312 TaxID=3346441 RepID=UPI0036E1C151
MTDTTKDRHPATRPSHAWAYARWSTGSLLIAGTALAGALAELLNGGPLGTCLALLAVTVVTGRGHIRARDQFRRGWRYGYESAIRTALEYQAGKIPDVETRAAVLGDPIPEPWEQHVSPVKPRSSQ